jgi:hypothetical protein
LIEQHRLLDSKGKLNPDAATHNLITQRDSFIVSAQGKDPLGRSVFWRLNSIGRWRHMGELRDERFRVKIGRLRRVDG